MPPPKPRSTRSAALLFGLTAVLACQEAPGTPASSSGGTSDPAPASDPAPRAVQATDDPAARDAWKEGRVALKEGRASDAARAFERAVELDPGLAGAQLGLGRVLILLSRVVVGSPTRDREMLARAAEALTVASELLPEDVEAPLKLGEALELAGLREEAVDAYRMALGRDDTLAHGWKRLGTVLRDLGRSDEANQALERARTVAPTDHEVWFESGQLFDELERVEDALAAYRRSLELNWSVPAVYTSLATALRTSGDADGAKQAVEAFRKWTAYGKELSAAQRAAADDVRDNGAQVVLAETLLRGHLVQQATPVVRRVLRREPDNERAQRLAELLVSAPADPPRSGRFVEPVPAGGDE